MHVYPASGPASPGRSVERSGPSGSGIAQDRHFAEVICGRDRQQSPQQDAVRSRHGSIESQTTHQEGRTILSASRPMMDKALFRVVCTRDIVLVKELFAMYPSLIVPGMKKGAFLLTFLLFSAVPLTAQTTEFGVLFGGSKRVIKQPRELLTPLSNDGFSFSNSSIDLYYATQLDPGAYFKLQVGRIEGPVVFVDPERVQNETINHYFDLEGEVQHVEGLVEYRFSEAFGSTGLFAGVGMYRTTSAGHAATVDYGFPIGLTGDFPITRTYGVIVAATYHMTNADLRPRYLTVSGGLRIGF